MKEKLELVTDFASLRAGMIVVVKGCGWCPYRHRGILVSKNRQPALGPDGSIDRDVAWSYLPRTRCGPGFVPAFSADAVALGNVFRVVDDLESTAETKQRRSVPA